MKKKVILIGASTGGPGHLKKILSSLDKEFSVPIIIAQHMNQTFIKSFVNQFDNELKCRVSMVEEKQLIKASNVYICSKHFILTKEEHDLFLSPNESFESFYNPSVECLFQSALDFTDSLDILAILLTGIGCDGALSLSNLQKKGANCIAESKSSAIVYGMPKRAVELNSNITSLDLKDIITKIKNFGENYSVF